MKVLAKVTFFFILFLVVSCSETETPAELTGHVEFSFSGTKSLSGGRIQADAKSVIVTVSDMSGNILYNRKKLTLYQFGAEYVSEPVALPAGTHQLTEFLVTNENDEVIYAAPLEGSELAYLVQNPLPVEFNITKDETQKIVPEVLAVESNTPSDFGYTTFAFDVVETFTFSIAAFIYDDSTANFELTTAGILINDGADTLYSNVLEPKTNHIRIREDHTNYLVTVTKPGYEPYFKVFSKDTLKNFTGMNVLIVKLLESNNKAMSFDGFNDYLNFGSIYDSVQLPVSMAAWVWVDPSVTSQAPIFVSQNRDNLYNGFWFVINPTHLFAGYGDGFGENSLYYRRDKSASHNAGSNFGKWIHVAAVIRGATDTDLYINGVNIGGEYYGNSPYPMSSYFPASDAESGYLHSNGVSYFFKGAIDELRIWDRALTQGEITSQMTSKETVNTSGLIGHWNFDESAGNVFDLSGHGHHGSVHGATRISADIPGL